MSLDNASFGGKSMSFIFMNSSVVRRSKSDGGSTCTIELYSKILITGTNELIAPEGEGNFSDTFWYLH